MNCPEHDPLPWKVAETVVVDKANVTNAHGFAVCTVHGWPEEDLANEPKETAAFIVAACNSHADLLAACEAVMRPNHTPLTWAETCVQLEAAIRKAKGGPS